MSTTDPIPQHLRELIDTVYRNHESVGGEQRSALAEIRFDFGADHRICKMTKRPPTRRLGGVARGVRYLEVGTPKSGLLALRASIATLASG